MYPVLLELGSLTIHSWGFCFAISFAAGIFVAYKIARSKNLSPDYILDGAIYVIIAAVIGSRILYVLEYHDYFIKHPIETIMLHKGGMTFAGGLGGALIAILIYTRIMKISVTNIFDICTAPTFLGMAIGKIGCFLNGCCYGIPTNLPCGIKFPGLTTPVHPTQLYDVIMDTIFFIYIISIYNSKKYNGHILLRGVFFYSFYRFFIEFLRINPRYFIGLSQAQFITLSAFIISSFLLLKNRTSSNEKNKI